jgi:hypothetical protein
VARGLTHKSLETADSFLPCSHQTVATILRTLRRRLAARPKGTLQTIIHIRQRLFRRRLSGEDPKHTVNENLRLRHFRLPLFIQGQGSYAQEIGMQ